MDFPIALYKPNGTNEIHGLLLQYSTADNQEDLDKALSDGWVLKTLECKDQVKSSDSDEKSKDDLLAEAKELGIEAKGTWGIAKLAEAIEAKKAE